jgi:uncharacterized damage-inducible protein DinB
MQQQTKLSGSILALLSEYKRAIDELIAIIKPINEKQLIAIVDKNATYLDCISIQSILSHVIYSGYCYTIYIENHIGNNKPRLDKIICTDVNKYVEQLNLMLEYNTNFFKENPNVEIEQIDNTKKIVTSWNQLYDIEQLLEHAIVHILRHRRQIENFINQINFT